MPQGSETGTVRYDTFAQEAGTASLARIAAVVGPTVRVSSDGTSIEWTDKGISLLVDIMPDNRRPGVAIKGDRFRTSYEDPEGDLKIIGREHDLIIADADGITILNGGDKNIRGHINSHIIDTGGNYTEGSLPQALIRAKFEEAGMGIAPNPE